MTTNALWRPVFWEPVADTGERLMVGVLLDFADQITAHRIIRDDVLDSLYGNKAAVGARTLIETGLKMLVDVTRVGSIREASPTLLGLEAGPLKESYAESLAEALRTAALLHSSLANMDKLEDIEESVEPVPEEANRLFATEVRIHVLNERPDLEKCFNRALPLIPNGQPIKFGFCSPRSLIHFGMMSPSRQSAGLRDAHARLWELYRAKEFSGISMAALILASPRQDDAILSPKQRESLDKILREIEREADSYEMRFIPVTTVRDGASRVIEFA
ncbi:hypothetical protein SAMN02949497_1261 [Methylomagnum ishizawai]|uniref:Uncharacterized protein n=1 Tax=Methylomagnum ishizawai TaxID=1760988 RepID=A0A1Y6D1U8_9GAMM|nr:hypothetical protein [Methylomagnum ishizawai]SMF93965.1 hypothetical protein SAMN02949497_1261 [Methylomagnum ishizawai]